MFRTVFPSIIRSSRLHIQQQAYVKLKLQGWVKLLVNVYHFNLTCACCCMCSLELLMMDGKTVRNMYSVLQE
jgi:hypothetical protein